MTCRSMSCFRGGSITLGTGTLPRHTVTLACIGQDLGVNSMGHPDRGSTGGRSKQAPKARFWTQKLVPPAPVFARKLMLGVSSRSVAQLCVQARDLKTCVRAKL